MCGSLSVAIKTESHFKLIIVQKLALGFLGFMLSVYMAHFLNNENSSKNYCESTIHCPAQKDTSSNSVMIISSTVFKFLRAESSWENDISIGKWLYHTHYSGHVLFFRNITFLRNMVRSKQWMLQFHIKNFDSNIGQDNVRNMQASGQ